MLVIAELVQTVCVLVPTAELSVIVLVGFTVTGLEAALIH